MAGSAERRWKITPERYHAILEAFLEYGPHFPSVARRVGIGAETAKRAWEQGWDVPYGVAINKVYDGALERQKARANSPGNGDRSPTYSRTPFQQVSKTFENSPDANSAELLGKPTHVDADSKPDESTGAVRKTSKALLQESAINAVQAEMDLLQAFRSNVAGATMAANRLLVGLDHMAGAAAENLALMAANPMQVTPMRVLDPLEKFARIVQILTSTTKSVMEMQRLLLGAPQSITETRGGGEATSPDELAEKFAKASRVIDLMRRTKLIDESALPKPEALQDHFEETGPVRTTTEPTTQDDVNHEEIGEQGASPGQNPEDDQDKPAEP